MDCIAQIMEFYHNKAKSARDPVQFNKVCLSNLLIKLMKNFNGKATPEDNLQLRNCLILLINLFSNDDSPDHYNQKGKGSKELSVKEKDYFKELLASEFLNN
ncbi:MAG: hypothetical protein ACFFDX_11195 [Candidatus Odinarchaeota archaeon]